MQNGMVFITCPKCKGLGGPVNIDGKHLICSECKNAGYKRYSLIDYVSKTLDEFIAFSKRCERELMYVGEDGASTRYGDGWLENDLEMLIEPFIHRETDEHVEDIGNPFE